MNSIYLLPYLVCSALSIIALLLDCLYTWRLALTILNIIIVESKIKWNLNTNFISKRKKKQIDEI